ALGPAVLRQHGSVLAALADVARQRLPHTASPAARRSGPARAGDAVGRAVHGASALGARGRVRALSARAARFPRIGASSRRDVTRPRLVRSLSQADVEQRDVAPLTLDAVCVQRTSVTRPLRTALPTTRR